MKALPTIFFLLSALTLTAATVRYVNVNNANPAPPFTEWASAATNIQDAVDAAVDGDEIVVTNGIYATGGRPVGTNLLVNRVAVDKPLTVRSVNGPGVTIIKGYQVPGTIIGDGAIRCVYLTNGARLSGFTLTNGATRGPYGDTRETRGGGVFCQSANAFITKCVIVGNSAGSGGGAAGCALNYCTLSGNSASYGGGASGSTLNNCALTGNSASAGGGAEGCQLDTCALTGNSARYYGGGAYVSVLNNCTLVGNHAYGDGGGTWSGTLNNCIVYFNTSGGVFANFHSGTLQFCCTTPLPDSGAGNITAEPQLASTTHLSVVSPCRAAGAAHYAHGTDLDGESWASPPAIGCDEYRPGEVTGPLSVSIQTSFTTVATGFPVALSAVIDGRTAASRWDFADGTVISNRPLASHIWTAPGSYSVTLTAFNEDHPDGVSATALVEVVNPSVHYVAADSSNSVAPFASWATAARTIQEAVDAAALPGALVLVTNGVYKVGGRVIYGGLTNRVALTKPIRVESVNGPESTTIEGYQVPNSTNGSRAVRCAYLTNSAVLSGFTLTKGATLSSGTDSERTMVGGGIWCESASAVVSNCVLIKNVAFMDGGGIYRGSLSHCTLVSNVAGTSFWGSGGGASNSVLSYCTLIGNSAVEGGGAAAKSLLDHCMIVGNSAKSGGGTAGGTLTYCTITSNSASAWGGGASGSTLANCVVIGNSTTNKYDTGAFGGGINESVAYNSIIYFNTDKNTPSSGNHYFAALYNCCTTPLSAWGAGSITRNPLLADLANGNLRLQPNSPCINAGNNTFAPGTTDLDGNPRIVGGTVDIGAYEFQTPASQLSYAWLQQYGLPTDGSADFTDPDADRANNWQEWQSATIPTNALSVLRLLTPQTAGTNLSVSWQSVSNKLYFLERSTGLGANASFLPLATNLAGQAGTTTFTDTNAAGAGPRFYRVGVQ